MRRAASRQHTCSCFPLICAVAAIADAITNLFQINENFHHDSLYLRRLTRPEGMIKALWPAFSQKNFPLGQAEVPGSSEPSCIWSR